MEHPVEIASGPLMLAGVLHTPDGAGPVPGAVCADGLESGKESRKFIEKTEDAVVPPAPSRELWEWGGPPPLGGKASEKGGGIGSGVAGGASPAQDRPTN